MKTYKGLLMLLVVSLLGILKGEAQNLYWSFDEGETYDSGSEKQMLKKFQTQRLDGTKSEAFLKRNSQNQRKIPLAKLSPSKTLSVELLLRFRTDETWLGGEVIESDYGVLRLYFRKITLGFTARVDQRGKLTPYYSKIKPFYSGMKNISYFLDDCWHHVVCVFDGIQGRTTLYVDGQILVENKELPPNSVLGNQPFRLFIGNSFSGDIDEIGIYDKALNLEEVREGMKKSIKNHKNAASLSTQSSSLNTSKPSIQIDPREFAPGHPKPNISAYHQLQAFPFPRYAKGHNLLPLFNWMGIPYIGGLTQDGIDNKKALSNSLKIMELMGDKYGYSLVIPNTKAVRPEAPLVDQIPLIQGIIKLANRREDLPLGVISLWRQTDLRRLGEERSTPYIARFRQLPDDYLLKDAEGRYLMINGGRANGKRGISPVAPGDLIKKDGKTQRLYFKTLLDLLDRPIDAINENGETHPVRWSEKIKELDPKVKKDFQDSNINDWELYTAQKKTRLRKLYSDPFLSLPELKDTRFSWYGVDGGPIDRFEWKEARYIHRPMNGQYYSTPDFYPRFPYNWPKWQGPWRGWDWLVISRQKEVALGDPLFSPFLGAGWDLDPEKNIRPSQWLGLLKLLGPIGAEFFYVGFFNLTFPNQQGKNVFADPDNYIWQAALPSYAQAVTSRYETILRNGELLQDNEGKPLINFPVKDPRILISARKSKVKSIYILAGAVLPMSNQIGIVPDQLTAEVELEGKKFLFNWRRQGSVYELDLSKGSPVIRQLDAWHQTGHPFFWSKDMHREAEVWDEAKGISLQTDFPKGNDPQDLTTFTSYACAEEAGAKLEYAFDLSEVEALLHLDLKARFKGKGKCKIEVSINNKPAGELQIGKSDWENFNLQIPTKKGEHPRKLSLRIEKAGLELDSFSISTANNR